MTVWTPPGPLTQPVPRRAKMKASVLVLFAPFLTVFAIVLVPLLLSAAKSSNDVRDLKAHGVETKAKIDGLYTREPRSGTTYYAVYHFPDPARPNDAKSYISGEDRIERSLYESLKPNDSIEILYDTRDPEHSAVEGELERKTTFDFSLQDIAIRLGIPAAVFLGVGAFGLMKFFREKRLLQMGTPACATIVKEVEVQGRNGRTARVTYAFKDSSGQIVQGTRTAIPTDETKREKSRAYRASLLDSPTVLYDPNDSSKNMLYPGALARLV